MSRHRGRDMLWQTVRLNPSDLKTVRTGEQPTCIQLNKQAMTALGGTLYA